jgi:two-component sensor histidine kinase
MPARLHDVIEEVLEPYRVSGQARFEVRGPEIQVSPRFALALSMALHELATNATKYGALSNATGQVRLTWLGDRTLKPPRLLLRWQEKGGPPVTPPSRKGFGSRLIERSLAQDLDADVRIEYAATGVVCTVEAPLDV